MHHLVTIGASMLLVACSGAAGQSAPANAQEIIDDRVEAGLATGIVVGIVRKDGSLEFYSAGTLRADGTEEVDENTIFEIGSISKVFTTLLLARMEEAGELKLDDSVQKYLPPGVTMPSKDGTPITLEHLATHTSGLPRWPSNFNSKDPKNPYACYTYQQMYDFLSSHELEGELGGNGAYSNLGMGLLGHVLELQSGKTYEALLLIQVCQPLGMTSTTTKPREADADRVAGAHQGRRPGSAWDIPTLAGCGDINSTASDMLTFTAANLGQIHTSLASTLRRCHVPRVKTGAPEASIGLGWHVSGKPGHEITWHNGGTGGFASYLGVRPDTGEGVVVLSNSSYRGVDQIGRHLLDEGNLIFDFPDEIEIDPATLQDFVGTYQLTPKLVVTIEVQDDRLMAKLTGQGFNEVYPTGPDEFCYRSIEAKISFHRDDQDKVDRLVLHQSGRNMEAAMTN